MLLDALRAMNSAIEVIDLSYNPNIDEGYLTSLGEFIKNSKYIEEIHIQDNNLTDKGIEILVPYLHGHMTLKTLFLSINPGITDKSILCLTKFIESSNIKYINIEGTFITDSKAFFVPLAQSAIKNGSSSLVFCYE